jgi:hypothetical protein
MPKRIYAVWQFVKNSILYSFYLLGVDFPTIQTYSDGTVMAEAII